MRYAKGCHGGESPSALQIMDDTNRNWFILQQECSRASSLFSSMTESPGKVLVEMMVSTQTYIKKMDLEGLFLFQSLHQGKHLYPSVCHSHF